MTQFFDASREPGVLTLADIVAAVEKMKNQVHVPCGSKERPHLFSSKILTRTGWFLCAECFNVIHITQGEITHPQPKWE